jgi:hypothetical protein
MDNTMEKMMANYRQNFINADLTKEVVNLIKEVQILKKEIAVLKKEVRK